MVQEDVQRRRDGDRRLNKHKPMAAAKLGRKRGNTMEWVNFKVKEGEREKLKNDAYAHRMNISEYLRWLIDKQRKEDEWK